MLSLDVTIDTKSGFCFGVEFAIEMAEDASDILAEIGAIQNLTYNESLITDITVNKPLSD